MQDYARMGTALKECELAIPMDTIFTLRRVLVPCRYGAASDASWGNSPHDSGSQGWLLMRRITHAVRGQGPRLGFGPIFWLARSAPLAANLSITYPLYTAMDATTRQDAAQYLASLGESGVIELRVEIDATLLRLNSSSLPASAMRKRVE